MTTNSSCIFCRIIAGQAEASLVYQDALVCAFLDAHPVAEGHVLAACKQRHRHQEWIRFLRLIDTDTPVGLDLHLIADNYATHKHPKVKKWLSRHRRFHLHFIPTSSSWLNLIERWFRNITDKRIRRGVFKSVEQLVTAIMDYIAKHNDNPETFAWTATAEEILAKVRRARAVLDKISSV